MKTSWKKLEEGWRKQLLSYARGNILEVGVGTGNNLKYYPIGSKVTASDMSSKLIEKAKRVAEDNGVKVNFIVSPIEDLQLEKQSFDTIVSTFTLCAYEDPVQVLGQFHNWCKPEGTILLMEYGLSKYKLVRWLQKKWEPVYYRRTGFHIDRDMPALFSASKFRVKKVEIRYAGIVYLVWAALYPEPEI